MLNNKKGSISFIVVILCFFLLFGLVLQMRAEQNEYIQKEVQGAVDTIASAALKSGIETMYLEMERLEDARGYETRYVSKEFKRLINSDEFRKGTSIKSASIQSFQVTYSGDGTFYDDGAERNRFTLETTLNVTLEDPFDSTQNRVYNVRSEAHLVHK